MSFARVGRPQHSKGKRVVRLKKSPAPKKEWVNTVNDLSVYKLTNAELKHRHEIHKSHNKAAAQWELKEKALKRRFRHIGSPAPLDQASLSIIREVFSDQLLLKDVLARSDRALAVVKDLFGDTPRRQTGHPSVTMAPPVHQRLEPPPRLSLMDQQALNEVNVWEEEYSDEDSCPSAHSDYRAIQRDNLPKMKPRSKSKSIQQEKDEPESEEVYREDFPVTPPTSGRASDQTALNATVAVRRVWPRQKQLVEEEEEDPPNLVFQVLNPKITHNNPGKAQSNSRRTSRQCVSQSSDLHSSSVASLSGDQTSLRLLQDMLGQVEAELDSLNPGDGPASRTQRTHGKQGLTGFSVALVSTLGRLVHLLKQKDEAIQEDARERERLEEGLKEQRGLINALTAETMTLREDVAALQARLQQQTAEVEQKLDTVVMVMGGLGLLEIQDDRHQEPKFKAADRQLVAERDPHPLRRCVSPAVLLSPPRQGHNWQQIPVTHPAPPCQEHLSVEASRSRRDVQTRSSSSSPSGLPVSGLPAAASSASQVSDFSAEAVLAEIAKISRQNELVKAQLGRSRDLGSAFGGAPDGERRPQTAGGAGRVTPQSVGERSTSASSSAARQNHQRQAPEGQLLLPQETSPDCSVNTVEQRLLELNRQSAAARGRLLELIEQQKQNTSAAASPAASPIPASAVSPPSAGSGRSPDGSVMLPEREKQFGVPEASSHSFGGERRGRAQMDREREREGWFALSSHVR